jgi:hypothetical protein
MVIFGKVTKCLKHADLPNYESLFVNTNFVREKLELLYSIFRSEFGTTQNFGWVVV